GAANALVEVLKVYAKRRNNQRARDIKPTQNTMELGEPLAETVGELHGAEENCARPSQAMRQQIPLEALIVLPNGIVRMPKEALVVVDNVGDHQPNDGKDCIFGSEIRRSSTNLDGGSGHG